ncbi:uncharacterized protein LOC105158035 [Sesamum indicum]|uniref:Uncharacterized protein LOC105158035 n=1 Tax=Sesamum indicum TaxID=4182 RepID=A0A6I9SRE3_SESIN|nr:uncharacterized protein LOC105158035 [Sesamum indicum]
MKGEKRKRKREEKAATVPDDRTKQEEQAEEVVEPPPTEEEVEEFFAILRRMRVAVKYFKKDASNSKDGGDRAQNQAVDGAELGGKRVAENIGLDLNAVPAAESSLL